MLYTLCCCLLYVCDLGVQGVRVSDIVVCGRCPAGLFSGKAEATLAQHILVYNFFELGRGESRPIRIGHKNLGISGLPQQEIAQAHVSAGAYDDVRVGILGRGQIRPNGFLVDRRRIQRPGSGIYRYTSCCPGYFPNAMSS